MSALVLAIGAARDVIGGTAVVAEISWIPALAVSLDLRFDALALIFTLAIAGIGIAIVTYSTGYFSPDADLRRFVALLVAFAGAMIGIVVSDNLFGLFVFWELTTVTSYLLVGFQDEKGSARAAALEAILTTSLGGLAMLGGFVLLAQAAGTAVLSEIVAAPPTGALATVAIVLVLIGAFTKSAQAPFHFWLPGAMAAPTPASAYLHSATMVKAGILLLLRLAPGFAAAAVWTPVVATVGLVTMTIGAWRALRQTDLKLILAYGTVSQLGFMTALVGLGSPLLLHAALAVLVAHVLFKSALFLVVGAIDHQAGTQGHKGAVRARATPPRPCDRRRIGGGIDGRGCPASRVRHQGGRPRRSHRRARLDRFDRHRPRIGIDRGVLAPVHLGGVRRQGALA